MIPPQKSAETLSVRVGCPELTGFRIERNQFGTKRTNANSLVPFQPLQRGRYQSLIAYALSA